MENYERTVDVHEIYMNSVVTDYGKIRGTTKKRK